MRFIKLSGIVLLVALGMMPVNSYGTNNSFITCPIAQNNLSDWKKLLANPEVIKFLDSSKIDIFPTVTISNEGSYSVQDPTQKYSSIIIIFDYLQWHEKRETALRFLAYALDLLPTGKVDDHDQYAANMIKQINAWLKEHNLPVYEEIAKNYTRFIVPELAEQGKLFKTLVESLTPEENKAMNELDKNTEIPVLSICFINDNFEYDCLRTKFMSK